MSKIVYLATHGFAVRMIFQTGLLRKLTDAGHEVQVIVPDPNDENVVALCLRDGVTAVAYTVPRHGAHNVLKTLRKYVVEDIRANPVLWDKHRMTINKAGPRKPIRRLGARVGLLLNDVVNRLPSLRHRFLGAERRLLRRVPTAAFVKSLDPDLIVSTYPVTPPEPEILLAAQWVGIRTVLHLLSWDNITAKGHFQALADHYIVWGPTMARELRDFYGVTDNRISACGVPHFDLYFKSDGVSQTTEIENLIGSDRYLFFAMSAPRWAPGETAILKELCRETAPGGRLEGVRVVARPHPSVLRGVLQHEATVRELSALEQEAGLLISYPKLVDRSNMNWSVRDDDMAELVHLVRHAAVVINSGSTVNVEALAMGRPVIVTAYDGPRARPYDQSAVRLQDYPHLAKLYADGGAVVVKDHEHLLRSIRVFLDDPDHLSGERRYALRQQIGDQQGDATEKVARALLQQLQT